MKRISFLLLRKLSAVLLMLFLAACSARVLRADYRVIPLPATVETTSSPGFRLDSRTRIRYAAGPATARTAQFLASWIQEASGLALSVDELADGTDTANCIRLIRSDTVFVPESYYLRIDAHGIRLVAGDDEGLFRGVQTLRKSLPETSGGTAAVEFPAGVVRDAPRFRHRGVMLDVARHFYPAEFLRKTVDMLALHNLNRLHLHLTDDQGWRIEIRKYPRLTQVGAFRADSVAGRYGGYYTQQELRELVRYARERFVTIIPEIDMPGHVEALLAAFPELGCTGGPYTISAKPGVRRDVLCVGNPRTVAFMEEILAEVMEVFPSEWIHVGGDEVPDERWKACPRCREAADRHRRGACDGHSAGQRLQGWFMGRIDALLRSRGRRLVGWDEILDGEAPAGATVMMWRGNDKGAEALRRGHPVILAPNHVFYFDYYQSVDIEREPAAVGGRINAETVYRADLPGDDLTGTARDRILGLQGNLWSTFVPTPAAAEYMLLPRTTALAEKAWCARERLDFDDFLHRLPRMQALLRQTGWSASPHLFDLQAVCTPDTAQRRLLVGLSSGAAAEIRYTLDGSPPGPHAARYDGPLSVRSDASLRAVAVTPGGLASDTLRREIRFSKATLRPVVLLTQPAARYAGNRLTDGVRGTMMFARGGWTGYSDRDLVVVVDLGEQTRVSHAGISTLVDCGSHILDATALEAAVSLDGKTFRTVARMDCPARPFSLRRELPVHELVFAPVEARYVRITARRARRLPDELTAAHGKQPFLFVDELIVR